MNHAPVLPEVINGAFESGILFLCDHASNAVPEDMHGLGLPPGELQRHIGWDIGAAAVTRALAAQFRAPAVLSTFSRLVIDPNRGRDDPTLVMKISDGAIVPGNRDADEAEVEARIRRFYDPYDHAVGGMIAAAVAAGFPPAIISMHSFTPVWHGTPRPWEIGILWRDDARLAGPLMESLRGQGFVVGDNEPYIGVLDGDTLYRHALTQGLRFVLIEVRQDLIATQEDTVLWAHIVARHIRTLRLGCRNAGGAM
ncbi:MAG: N-formylglutamate amidohydrolase [Methylobacteriaceae bacterium]|nr:N-formylglutamate amidohydrolase [Methylobacteriaceae bacterium]